MKICLSFDDGRIDNYYNAFHILKKYNLVASFHIVTGFIDSSFITNSFGEGRKSLTIEQLLEMKRYGMEICSHGDKHIMDKEDFKNSFEKMKSWGLIAEKSKIGFSIPNSQYSTDELETFWDDNSNNLLYIRAGRSHKCYSFLNKIRYLLYKITHSNGIYYRFNKNNIITDICPRLLYSLVVKRNTKEQSINNLVLKAQKTSNAIILMFHSIVNKPDNSWEWSISSFERLCKDLSANENVEIITIERLVAKYEK